MANDANDTPDLPSLVRAEQTLVRLPSRPHWIEATVEYLRQKAVLCGACHETRSRKLLLALQEALANAVIHGNLERSSELKDRDDDSFAAALAQRAADPNRARRFVEVLVEYDGARCRWTISDQGNGFDVDAAMRRLESDDPEIMLASGRGILIMRSVLDDVKYQHGGRQLILTMNRDSGEEKREHPRADATQPLRVAPVRADGSVAWDAAYEAVALNFSEKGLGLIQEQLAASDRIIICMISGNNEPIYLPAEVRHCRGIADGLVELGCRFQARAELAAPTAAALAETSDALRDIHDAVSELLLRQAGPPPGLDERRLHARVVYNARIEVIRAGQGEPVIAFARDLSKGGLAFITTTLLGDEKVVIVLPQVQRAPLRIQARIVRCNKIKEGFYDVGARFIQMMEKR